MNNEKEVLFSVSHLKKYFQVGKNATLKAVDDVSFEIYKGETLGMVGESGCGKTTCGRTCIGLYSRTDGEVLFKGKDPQKLTGKEKQNYKKSVQMVFQDPYGSLDPRMTVAEIIGEGIDIHHLAKNKKERNERIYHYLELVGLNREHANRFVHEFSGGQRQRIGIARALAVEPEFLVLDEPISALDVSIQAQIVNLLIDLQKRMGLTYLFVAHDLSMVRFLSDTTGVMKSGKLVEMAPTKELFENIVTEKKELSEDALNDMIIANIVLKYTQSNSVCYVKDGQAIGIGAGQQSRIHCTRLAGDKADKWFLRQSPKALNLPFKDDIRKPDRDNTIDVYLSDDYQDVLADGKWEQFFTEKPEPMTREERAEWIKNLDGVTLGSDAFIPFSDNIERANRSGVKYVAQAGGSKNDQAVIDACNEFGILMAFTGLRLFHH